jgi:GntR family transcriptional regulator
MSPTATLDGFRPLYRQAYELFLRRIINGQWGPGRALPSENELAIELGISQGTVRKALDVMVSEKLIERRQGKGTYVAKQTAERELFRFFRLAHENGDISVPTSANEKVVRRVASAKESEKLQIPDRSKVIEIDRVRSIRNSSVINETIVVPLSFFPTLDKSHPIPNSLYTIYQGTYGVNIVSVDETLRAVLATEVDAKNLGVSVGDPLLEIERVAVSIDGSRVEYRVSRCDTTDLVYAITLR